MLQRQRQAEEAAKKAEVEALQQQIAQMKALQSNLPGGQKKAPGNKVSVDDGVVLIGRHLILNCLLIFWVDISCRIQEIIDPTGTEAFTKEPKLAYYCWN